MAKARTAFASEVCGDDDFVLLSADARALYLHLGFEATHIGEVVGLRRLVRGFNVGNGALGELLSNGYLLEVDGRTFITHHRVNNCKPNNPGTRGAAKRQWEDRPPGLEWENPSEPFDCKMIVSLTLGQRSSNVLTEQEQEEKRTEELEQEEKKEPKGESPKGEGETQEANCPECHNSATLHKPYASEPYIECPWCERSYFIDSETGEMCG